MPPMPPREWGTMRTAIAAVRRELAAKGRGGIIYVHHPGCGLRYGGEHDCRLRMQLVRAR